MVENSIILSGVSKTFVDGSSRVHAVEMVDISIAKGEFVALIGPSGCGKSTVLRMLGDLESPTTGSVSIEGVAPAEVRRKRSIGMVFQEANLLPWRTVVENIGLPLEIAGRGAVPGARKVDDLIELVGLKDFRNALPWQLSAACASAWRSPGRWC